MFGGVWSSSTESGNRMRTTTVILALSLIRVLSLKLRYYCRISNDAVLNDDDDVSEVIGCSKQLRLLVKDNLKKYFFSSISKSVWII